MRYAICKRCHKEMAPGISCKPQRNRYYWGEGDTYGLDITWNCHDCNCAPGQWHHYGCALKFNKKTGEQSGD